jgi:hypothetical protein
MGHAAGTAESSAAATLSPHDMEQRQGVWWYLLIAAILLFVSETVVSNRATQRPAGLPAVFGGNAGI